MPVTYLAAPVPFENVLTPRKWVFIRPPGAFEVAPCDCGNAETQWSEFEDHCWCSCCQKDFVPAHPGVLGGPIPYGAAVMLGLCFDRVVLDTGNVERFDPDTGEYVEHTKLNR